MLYVLFANVNAQTKKKTKKDYAICETKFIKMNDVFTSYRNEDLPDRIIILY